MKQGLGLAYTPDNRLQRVTGGPTYSYNAKGQRVRKAFADGGEIHYLYDTGGALIAETDEAGVVLREYVHFNGRPFAVLDPNNGGTVVSYIHTDHLGTPQIVTDASGTSIWEAVYEPFGQVALNEDPDGDGNAFVLNIRFPGQYFDAESGLHYNYFRDYDPATGRYIVSDPIGLDGGTNTFVYVTGNPLNSIDALGLVKWVGDFQAVGVDAEGLGGIYWTFLLFSDCVDGVAWEVEVESYTPQISVGLPATLLKNSPYDSLVLEDWHPMPDPTSLEGVFSYASYGFALGPWAFGRLGIIIGDAEGFYTGSTDGSLDGGVAGGAGAVEIISKRPIDLTSKCWCEKWNDEYQK